MYWSYVMEHYCGKLGPLVHSRVYPYRSLTNSALLLEQIQYIDMACKPYALDSSDPVPVANSKGKFVGHSQPTTFTPAERNVLHDGYEQILSVEDGSKVHLHPLS
jgi:hypothetical protein